MIKKSLDMQTLIGCLFIFLIIDSLNIRNFMKKNYISVKIINQKYLYDVIKCYPNISSGRKNYSTHYKRILKNIFLSKIYNKNTNLNNKNFYKLILIN